MYTYVYIIVLRLFLITKTIKGKYILFFLLIYF